MSLSLKESCQSYERYCRRHSDTPTFEAFNGKHFTNLPSNPEVYADFKRTLTAARRATGLPVTRRLPSLFHKLSGVSSAVVAAEPRAVVQVKTAEKAFRATKTDYDDAFRHNVRPPAAPVAEETWTLESYKSAVTSSASVLLKEAKGLMVHLVPEKKQSSLEALACKLTKSTWESLRGKSDSPMKMRDGSTLDLTTVALDESDLAEFVQNRKKKIVGPYFIRFSRI